MINGIDVLFVVIGLVLLFVIVEMWVRYSAWLEWDRNRRRQRRHDSIRFKYNFEEDEYRRHLRRVFNTKILTYSFSHMTVAANRASESLREFNKIFSRSQ